MDEAKAPDKRYEVCAACGQTWNVSRDVQLTSGWYICPCCAAYEACYEAHQASAGRAS
jgi:hypothetical protein